MNSGDQRRSFLATAIGIIAIFAFLIPVGLYYFSTHKSDTSKSSLAAGYETQALTSPFTFSSKTWDEAGGAWTYNYTASVTPPAAITAARSQLSKGAYQVDARQPDQVSLINGAAILYRDLITEDVALKVQISPNPSQVTSAPPTLVTVTLSPMRGN